MGKLIDYENYDKEIRRLISKEIDRQHSFMRWHVAVQAFLFAAIIHFDKTSNSSYLFFVIVGIGLLASILSFTTYLASEEKIKRVFYFWDGYRKIKGTSYFDYPPVWDNPNHENDSNELRNNDNYRNAFGDHNISCFKRLCLKTIFPKTSPFIFMIAWIAILIIESCPQLR